MSDFEKLINASDLVEWIMETYPDWCMGAVRSIVDHVVALPSAQPEVVRCKDCKRWKDPRDYECPYHTSGDPYIDDDPEEDFFCKLGEMREEDDGEEM